MLFAYVMACFITLHGPDGKDAIRVDAASVFIIRHNTPEMGKHIAHGIKTIVYIDGQKFGVSETPEEVETLISQCGHNEDSP